MKVHCTPHQLQIEKKKKKPIKCLQKSEIYEKNKFSNGQMFLKCNCPRQYITNLPVSSRIAQTNKSTHAALAITFTLYLLTTGIPFSSLFSLS